MATHPSNLAWRIPWTEGPGSGLGRAAVWDGGWLQSMGLQRVGHN